MLARRAAFVSAALATLGCSPARPEPREPEVVAVPPAPEDAGTTAQADAAPPPRSPSTKPGEPPSMDVPAGVSETAQKRYTHLFESMRALYDTVDKIEEALPSCNVQDAACEARWRDVADQLLEIRKTRSFMYFCPGTSDEARQFAEAQKAHEEYFNGRLGKVNTQIDAAWSGHEERWKKLQEDAYQAKPFPCLSFACQDW